MRYDAASDKYVPVSWDEAFELAGRHFRGLENPNQAAFYTSGRLSNEATFLYQLFARELGTNNLPDCLAGRSENKDRLILYIHSEIQKMKSYFGF